TLVTRSASTGSDGRFIVANVPAGVVQIAVMKGGYATFSSVCTVDGPRLALGTVRLTRGGSMRIRIIDDRGGPVRGARISYGGMKRVSMTGLNGRATLSEVPLGRLDIHVDSRCCVSRTMEMDFASNEVNVVLQRAFHVRGRFVYADGSPVSTARLRVRTGKSESNAEIDASGAFDLNLTPHLTAELTLSAPDVRATTIRIDTARGGDEIDLGDVRADVGRIARGRVLSAATGA